MRYLICFTILLFLAAPGLMAQSQEEIDDALEFYPLEVGTYWIYKQYNSTTSETTYYSVEVVSDTTLANGKEYAMLRYKNVDGRFRPHYVFGVTEDEYGNLFKYALERVDAETAEVFQWTPTEDDAFNETLIDSLLNRDQGTLSTARRWEFVFETEGALEIEVTLFDEQLEALMYYVYSYYPTHYSLARHFGLADIEGGLVTLIHFRDSEGNEYTDPLHVNVPGEPDLPRTATLHANYPNPFNPSTMISFDLAEAAAVQLDVYDLTGRKIQSLLNEQKPAGTHTVQFQAGNLSSGVYIYRLQVGDVAQSRKMVLVK